jgi:hypothetical protein
MKRYVLAAVFVAALITSGWFLRPAAAAPALKEGLPKWEYKVVHREELVKEGRRLVESGTDDKFFTAALNPLGEDGWQLVAIDPRPFNGGGGTSSYVFRRPK